MDKPEKINKIEQKIELISTRFLSSITILDDKLHRANLIDIAEIDSLVAKTTHVEIYLKSGQYHIISFQDSDDNKKFYDDLSGYLVDFRLMKEKDSKQDEQNHTDKKEKWFPYLDLSLKTEQNHAHEDETEKNIDESIRSEINTELPYHFLSCEQCKRTDPILFSTFFREGTQHCIKCRYCSNKTSYEFDPLDAVREWNSRK